MQNLKNTFCLMETSNLYSIFKKHPKLLGIINPYGLSKHMGANMIPKNHLSFTALTSSYYGRISTKTFEEVGKSPLWHFVWLVRQPRLSWVVVYTVHYEQGRNRVRPRFFDQVGHQTINASRRNKYFFTKYLNHEQSRQKLSTFLVNEVL